jgi:hypothetical protein
VGPTLGRDSIVLGVRATIYGFTLVLLFMSNYYRASGLLACVALVLNLVIVLAALGTSACAYVGPSAEARHWERYKEYAPKFTDEEKRNMTLDEKLAIYNAHVAPSERLSCAEGNITGSHQKVIRCFTKAELESQQEAARDFMLAARRGSSM